jgi:DNA-binding response OmpR family regulator
MNAGNICPCCGRETERSNVMVSLDNNSISFGGRVVYLTPTVCEMVYALARRSPLPVTRETIMEQIYGGGDQPATMKTLDVQMVKARRKIAVLGLRIENVYGRGWRLVRADRDVVTAA